MPEYGCATARWQTGTMAAGRSSVASSPDRAYDRHDVNRERWRSATVEQPAVLHNIGATAKPWTLN